ncbi:protein kinase [Archangium minus]|uniref:protein kinase domain-containing protein n=1 Tax=Archangium minus TaxID=83450 RepID=UPI0037BF3DEC
MPANASPQPEPPPGKGADGSAFPVPGWDRYQHVRFLGQGGMGRVFLAYDPRLRRQVALKFVRDDHPELTHRFLSEARAQAKVNHERVCKVYEVGQVDGKVFIAMQYVDGRPLSAFVHELTVERKALVLRETALGVHEAHRAGLIHRDIKPSNIMVERGEDGVPRPYVMDFGLARDWNEGVTVTGTVLGTPHYMAPEQARGEVSRLDRRADVYSLGATFYALLTGQPPIQGGNGLEVLNNLATVDPQPLRALNQNIPPDVEAITLKCLEKEPFARYDSARALAEDLDRFLAGEPVLARTGPGYRLRKLLRKHRLFLSMATATLLAVAVAVGWVALVRREASERERLARRFTEKVERIESIARFSALSPLHDVREDRQAIQARMEELKAEIRQGGEQALGPGHYALGRGALALGDIDKAREHLEFAWQKGFHEPRVAYAIALVMGQLYQQQRLEVAPSDDGKMLEVAGSDHSKVPEFLLRDIEQRYRDPALAYLKQSQGVEAPSAEYVAALVAFHEGRLDDALAQLDAMSGKLPWFYEAPMLRGDILLARVYKHERNVDEKKADLDAGRKAYAAAITIAESVPAVHLALARLERVEMDRQRSLRGDVMPSYTRAHDALMRCLAVAPDDYMCWVELARLHAHLARGQFDQASDVQASDVEGALKKAMEVAERALAFAPARREARMVLANCTLLLAIRRLSSGGDPREQLRKAADLLESVRPEDRNPSFHYLFGAVFMNWADYEERIGENSLGLWGREIQELQALLAINDLSAADWVSLGRAYLARASNRRNSEPERDLEQAMSASDKVRRLDSKNFYAYLIMGEVYEQRARRLRNRGGDPTPDLMRALEQYRQGLANVPEAATWMHSSMAWALLELARGARERGGNPFPVLDEARASIELTMSGWPRSGAPYAMLGTLLAQRARYLRARGEDPGPSVREAEDIVKRGFERQPDLADFSVILGSVHVIRAGFNVDCGRAPGPDLAHAEEELRRGLAQSSLVRLRMFNLQDVWLQLGEVQTLRAKWQAQNGKARAEDFDEARKSYEKAIELAPDELEYSLRLGQLYSTWATWQKQAGGVHDLMLKRGLELVDRILKVRPDWVEAQELRVSLLQASQ